MLTEQRKRLLLDRLRRDGRLVAADLGVELGVSDDTVRRDLRELAQAGLLQRVHGGALPASPTVAPLDQRRSMAVEEKRRLGRAAAGLLSRGQTVFIDGGTTHIEIVRNIPLDMALTVVTHSPAVAAALEPHAAVDVILVGGTLLRHSMVSVGAAAHEAIGRLRVDVFFLGLTGLHPEEGATTGNFEEAAIKRAIVERAAETVSLVTAEKIGAVSPHAICGCGMIASLVVSKAADAAAFEARGLAILRA